MSQGVRYESEGSRSITWDEAQTICQDISSDSSSASLTIFKRMMNTGYQTILAEFSRPNTEKTQTASTVASQRYYQLPSEVLFVKSVTVTVSSVAYPVEEIEDQETWDYLLASNTGTSDIPTYYFIRPGFGVNGTEIGIYPTPASSSNTLTVIYESGDKDLSNDVYSTGTISLTNGDATVTGSGTTFTSGMVGRYLRATTDGTWYKIASFTSTTSLELENVFAGTSASGLSYVISEAFALPEDMQILPCYYALAHYFDLKRDNNDALKYRALFEQGLRAGKKRWSTKARSNIIRHRKPRSLFRNPNFPPGTIT